MGSNIDNRSGVPYSASLPLSKSSPCKTMPLVFMTRGEREARSPKFYPGALRIADHWPGAREEGSVEQPASNVTPQVSRVFDNELQVDLKIASHLAT
jgi:hypothetical protein